jgi:hypothetical protein
MVAAMAIFETANVINALSASPSGPAVFDAQVIERRAAGARKASGTRSSDAIPSREPLSPLRAYPHDTGGE